MSALVEVFHGTRGAVAEKIVRTGLRPNNSVDTLERQMVDTGFAGLTPRVARSPFVYVTGRQDLAATFAFWGASLDAHDGRPLLGAVAGCYVRAASLELDPGFQVEAPDPDVWRVRRRLAVSGVMVVRFATEDGHEPAPASRRAVRHGLQGLRVDEINAVSDRLLDQGVHAIPVEWLARDRLEPDLIRRQRVEPAGLPLCGTRFVLDAIGQL